MLKSRISAFAIDASTALVGLPTAGKTSLFQLLTSVKEGPHGGHGRNEAHIGVARVPDERLDELTTLFRPRKRVAATVEFADIAGATGGVQALVDVAATGRRRPASCDLSFQDPGASTTRRSIRRFLVARTSLSATGDRDGD
jgi:hypothetical protein